MKCGHVHCSCQAAASQEYCCNECVSELRDEGATECHCGHPACIESHATLRDSTTEPDSSTRK
jgi:hypothetical protein